jgi:hypothetical protein
MNRLFGTKNAAPKPTLDGAISNVRPRWPRPSAQPARRIFGKLIDAT